jgi:hypothetical protein
MLVSNDNDQPFLFNEKQSSGGRNFIFTCAMQALMVSRTRCAMPMRRVSCLES